MPLTGTSSTWSRIGTEPRLAHTTPAAGHRMPRGEGDNSAVDCGDDRDRRVSVAQIAEAAHREAQLAPPVVELPHRRQGLELLPAQCGDVTYTHHLNAQPGSQRATHLAAHVGAASALQRVVRQLHHGL